MTEVIFGPAPFDLRPFVRDAVEELGFFRIDVVDELAGILERLWPEGVSSTMLIYNGLLEPMSEDQKREAGLPRTRMNREVWPLLSAAGRIDSVRAIRETTTHVILAVQRERRNRQVREHPELFGGVKR